MTNIVDYIHQLADEKCQMTNIVDYIKFIN